MGTNRQEIHVQPNHRPARQHPCQGVARFVQQGIEKEDEQDDKQHQRNVT